MTKKEKYLEKMRTLFMEKGVEGWTMESLAESIGVTKMTLYNNFQDKEEIVQSIMNYRSNTYAKFFNELEGAKKSAIESFLLILDFQHKSPLPSEKTFYLTFRKAYPIHYKRQQIKLRRMLRLFITNNYEQGLSEGLYREGVDIEDIAACLISTMNQMMLRWLNEPVQIDLNKMHQHIITYHIRGLANEKGVRLLDAEMAKREKTNQTAKS